MTYVIRRLGDMIGPMARITGTEIRSLQLHFAQHLPDGKPDPKHIDKSDEIDEFRLWKILQAEKDTPAGLALAHLEHGPFSHHYCVSDLGPSGFDRNVLWLPEGDIP